MIDYRPTTVPPWPNVLSWPAPPAGDATDQVASEGVTGQLGGARLDVLAVEPPSEREAILKLSNVVLAPHVAWLADSTWERSIEVALANCRRLAAGEPLLHRVA